MASVHATFDRSHDAGPSLSSFYDGQHTVSDQVEVQSQECEGFNSYDEFCLMLRGRAGEGTGQDDCEEHQIELTCIQTNPRKFSYVHKWRRKVDPLDLTTLPPPTPLYNAYDSPSSPAASINLERICVTSRPPSAYVHYTFHEAPSMNDLGTGARSSYCEFQSHGVVDVPQGLQNVYDADIERILDEALERESSSSRSSASIPTELYAPQAIVGPEKRALSRNISSAIRWLPSRIKYTILSKTTHRGTRN